MRILITGAGGYIGCHLVPRLRAEGHEVIGVYRGGPRGASGWVFGPDHDDVHADLADARDIGYLPSAEIERKPPDTVIHLAGRVDINLLPNPKGAHLPPIPGPCDIGALYRDNVLATANVLDYCLKAGVKHLIFASTQAVYGMGYQEEPALNLAIDPLEHYAASKWAAEQLLEMGRAQGLMTSILRLPGVFGGDRKDGAVYNMCRDALRKGEIHVTHDFPLPMNVVHIEDVTAALVAAATRQPPNQNWVGGLGLDINGTYESCSLDILAEEIASLVPRCKVWRGVQEHPELEIDGGLAQTVLNWHPKPRKERLAQVLEEIRRGP